MTATIEDTGKDQLYYRSLGAGDGPYKLPNKKTELSSARQKRETFLLADPNLPRMLNQQGNLSTAPKPHKDSCSAIAFLGSAK